MFYTLDAIEAAGPLLSRFNLLKKNLETANPGLFPDKHLVHLSTIRESNGSADASWVASNCTPTKVGYIKVQHDNSFSVFDLSVLFASHAQPTALQEEDSLKALGGRLLKHAAFEYVSSVADADTSTPESTSNSGDAPGTATEIKTQDTAIETSDVPAFNETDFNIDLIIEFVKDMSEPAKRLLEERFIPVLNITVKKSSKKKTQDPTSINVV